MRSVARKPKPATAQLVVRNLEPGVKTRLQKRAKKHGRSMEEEVRDILRAAVKGPKEKPSAEGFGTQFASYFKGIGLREGEEIRELRGFPVRAADFDE
jgi:plasmid stability protein